MDGPHVLVDHLEREVLLVAEVPVRGVMGDSRAAGRLSQSEGHWPHFGNQYYSRLQQRLAQVAVMVGFTFLHCRYSDPGWTSVDGDNNTMPRPTEERC